MTWESSGATSTERHTVLYVTSSEVVCSAQENDEDVRSPPLHILGACIERLLLEQYSANGGSPCEESQRSVYIDVLLNQLEYKVFSAKKLYTIFKLKSWKLRKLSLTQNQLRQMPDNVFKYFPELTAITLSRNSIAKMPRSWFKHASSLRELNLEHNNLQTFPWANLPMSVVSLNLGNNSLKEVPPLETALWRHVEALDVSANQIDGSVRIPNKECSVRFLNLRGNHISSIALDTPELSHSSRHWALHLDVSNNALETVDLRVSNCYCRQRFCRHGPSLHFIDMRLNGYLRSAVLPIWAHPSAVVLVDDHFRKRVLRPLAVPPTQTTARSEENENGMSDVARVGRVLGYGEGAVADGTFVSNFRSVGDATVRPIGVEVGTGREAPDSAVLELPILHSECQCPSVIVHPFTLLPLSCREIVPLLTLAALQHTRWRYLTFPAYGFGGVRRSVVDIHRRLHWYDPCEEDRMFTMAFHPRVEAEWLP